MDMRHSSVLFFLFFLAVSCADIAGPDGAPIGFDTDVLPTKATPLEQGFRVWAVKEKGDVEQVVFNGTEVSYDSGSYTYGPLKYWDMEADLYRFCGFSPATSGDGGIGGASFSDVDAVHAPFVAFIQDNTTAPQGRAMRMVFTPLSCGVRFVVYETLSTMSVGDISLDASGFCSSGVDYSVGYDDMDDYDVTLLPSWEDACVTEFIPGTAPESVSLAYGTDITRVLPLGGTLPVNVTLSFDVTDNGSGRTEHVDASEVVIPAEFTPVRFNTDYVYVLKISKVGVSFDVEATLKMNIAICQWIGSRSETVLD